MEIPAESLRAAVVREIHSTILRYFREIMNRMEVARALGNESPAGTAALAVGHFKKRDVARITRAEVAQVAVVGTLDKRGPNYPAESGNIKANAIRARFLRLLSFFKPFFLPSRSSLYSSPPLFAV